MILRTTIGAFVASQETADAIEGAREDRMLLRSNLIVQQGGIAAAVSYLSEHETPPVLLVETTASGDALFQELEGLANVCAPNTRVFLVGRSNDIELYRTLIREGISDYLIGPLTTEQFLQSFRDTFTEADAAQAGRVIAFAGARGGVGSSVLAHHVGFALTQLYSDQVVVIDLDIPYGTAALVFNLQAKQSIADALSQPARLDEVLLERFLLPHDPSECKLSLLASPASLAAGINVTTEGLNKVLSLVRRMGAFIVLDLPHVWDPWCREILAECDDLVVVAEPDLASLRDAKNLIEYLGTNRGGDAPTRIVLNKVGAAKRAELSEKEFRDALGMSVDAQVPSDPAGFGAALNNGELLFKAASKSKACDAINEIAKIVSDRDETEEGEKKKGLAGLFKKKK